MLALLAGRITAVRNYQQHIMVAVMGLTLAVAWLLRPEPAEIIFGNWTPVSFTGIPLILSLNPEGIMVLIGVILALLAAPVLTGHDRQTAARVIAGALLFSALCVTALAYNL